MPPRTSPSKEAIPPYNREAEEGVLGAVLLSEEIYDSVRRVLDAGDFYIKRHRLIWNAFATAAEKHAMVDPTTVLSILRDTDKLKDAGGGDYLVHLRTSCNAASAGPGYAEIVRDAAHRRRVFDRSLELAERARDGNGFRPALEKLAHDVVSFDRSKDVDDLIDAWQLLDERPEEPPWLIKPLIGLGRRVILYGCEGEGKSLLTLQMAVQASNGLPVLGLYPVARPLSVLYLDLENGPDDLADRLRSLRITVKQEAGSEPRFLGLIQREQGIDCTTVEGRSILERAVSKYKPDLLIIDPLYKLGSTDMMYDRDLKPILLFLDALREEFGFGLWLCAHPRKSQEVGTKRGTQASDLYGASVLIRWTELLLVIPEEEDRLHVQKSRSRFLKKGDDIPFKRGGKWLFEGYAGPAILPLHKQILEALKSGQPRPLTAVASEIFGDTRKSGMVRKACEELQRMGKVRSMPDPENRSNRHPVWIRVPDGGAG